LIRSVTVIRDEKREPVYTHVQSIGYMPTPMVVANEDLFQMAVKEATKRLKSAEEQVGILLRYSKGDDLVRVQSALRDIESAAAQIEG